MQIGPSEANFSYPAPSVPATSTRHVTLVGATLVGVGAIVGGGILVLAGVALEATGPSALLAFALNGVVAVLTALSFAEMSAQFPESGGAYTFAKKVLTVRAAFAVGWILWFAYIVAAVLYGLGFAEYAAATLIKLWPGEKVPDWLGQRASLVLLALLATLAYALSLVRSSKGGGRAETIGKMALFVILIALGIRAVIIAPADSILKDLSPFFVHGPAGLASAMGFTFIALQGFDLIAAIGGEVKEPERTIPKAMLLSLGIALVVYLPLLLLVSTVGTPPGQKIAAMSANSPATVMADAARQFAGAPGYWMVTGAALLSTLSALSANILAATHVAHTMAGDRTLPRILTHRHKTRGTPVMAIAATALAAVAILFMLPDVASAGAAASLIFLFCFALVHGTNFLARSRSKTKSPFPTPFFPLVPLVGGLACVILAIFQAITVPAAGGIVVVWLGLGVILYFSLFADRAQAVDAFAEAADPELARLRGRHPLVLVPVANPENADSMVTLANAIATPVVGRVVLLTVVRPPESSAWIHGELPAAIRDAQAIVGRTLATSLAKGHAPETLMTVAKDPWKEIPRVASARRCESLLLGFSAFDPGGGVHPLETILNNVDCDVAILKSDPHWKLGENTRVVVPIGGKGGHDDLRARLLGSLNRAGSARNPVRPRHATGHCACRAASSQARTPDLRRRGDQSTPRNRDIPIPRNRRNSSEKCWIGGSPGARPPTPKRQAAVFEIGPPSRGQDSCGRPDDQPSAVARPSAHCLNRPLPRPNP